MQKYFGEVQDPSGKAVAGASITVRTSGGALATLYSDNGVTTTSNPVTAGTDGEYSFYAANGRYTLTISAPGFATEQKTDVVVQDLADANVAAGTFAGLTDAPTDNAQLAAALASKADASTTTAGLDSKLDKTSVVNALTSSSTTSALSAAQGKALKDTADALATTVAAKLTAIQAETDVASAATTDLGAVASEVVRITGTTTITSFGTVAAGTRREGRFAGALLLTHNATSLILPGGQSITTAANDRFSAVSLGSGNWLVLSYIRASGQPVISVINSGQAQDVTGVTYNSDGSVATYTLNGLTWALAYNSDGTPNTETSGTLVKTYSYSGGRFAGVTGAVNAGESRRGTLANIPTAANSSPGDRYFVTDVASRVVGSTDSGNLGQMFEFRGASGTGKWEPIGAYAYIRRVGSIAAPAGSLSAASGSAQEITMSGAASPAIPAALLVPGNRFRLTLHVHRTGANAAASVLVKIGQAHTSADTSATLVALSGTNNASCRQVMDVAVTSTTTVLTTNVMNSGGTGADGASGATEHTINAANPLYLTPWISAVTAGDAYQVLLYEIEQVA